MQDRSRLLCENDTLRRENEQLHELVGYLSADPEEGCMEVGDGVHGVMHVDGLLSMDATPTLAAYQLAVHA